MAFENFKPTIWSKYIQLETSKICVMEEDCNTKFQGEIGVGKQVKNHRRWQTESWDIYARPEHCRR